MTISGSHPSVLLAPAIQSQGTQDYTLYTDRQWTGVLLLSTSNSASSLPGTVSLGIGNGFLELVQFGAQTADTSGITSFTVPNPGALLQTLHFQAITLDLGSVSTPLEVSNTASVFFL